MNTPLRPLVAGLCLVLAQACAPTLPVKEADLEPPPRYPQSAAEDFTSGDLGWREFFADPQLVALLETAVANNNEIQVLLQRMNAARSEVLARRGEYLPRLDLEAGLTRERRTEYEAHEALEEFLQRYRFGARAAWEVDVWGRLRRSARAAALEYLASMEAVNFLTTQLVAEVAHLYYELQALDNQLATLKRNIELLEQARDIVAEMKRYGRTNLLAVKRYEAELNKNKAELYEIRQRITRTENRLNVLLGRFAEPIPRASEAFLRTTPPPIKTGVPAQLLDRRPDVRRAELEMRAAEIDLEAVKAEFYPRLELDAVYRLESDHPQYLFTPQGVVLELAADIVAPLFNRSRIIARYRAAGARQAQAVYEYQQVVIRAYAEVATELANLRFLEREYALKERQAAALEESIELAEQLFQSARSEYLEVLLVQREALEAKMELIEIKQEQLGRMIDLYRALGGGWK